MLLVAARAHHLIVVDPLVVLLLSVGCHVLVGMGMGVAMRAPRGAMSFATAMAVRPMAAVMMGRGGCRMRRRGE